MQPKFSIVLIARNEAKKLPHLIESLKEFKDRGGEVVLVDTGSSDGTAQLARDLGCKVEEVGDRFRITIDAETADAINKEFIVEGEGKIVKEGMSMFDYSSARNFAATLASNDMIATPDCDEVYTKFDIDAINKAIEEGVGQIEYNFVFSHDDLGNDLIKFMHSKFYDRSKMKWTGIIHEVLVGAVTRQFFGEDKIKLEHWQNVETNRDHYLTGLAYSCFKDPENDRNAHYFGRELMYKWFPRSAIKMFERHIAMNKWPAEQAQSYIHIGDIHTNLNEFPEAVAAYAKAFDIDGTRREPLMRLAEHYYKLGKADQVIAYAAAALQIKGSGFYADYQPYYEQLPHELLYWALWQKDEPKASHQHFDICMSYQPFNPKYLADYHWYYKLPKVSIIIPTIGRPEGLDRVLKSIDALNWPKEQLEVMIIEDEPRLGVPKRLKEGVEKATGDWIVYASNDIEFTPDSLIIAFITAMHNTKYFMAFNTGEVSADEGNICEHFMIHKKLLPKLGGEIFDTEFNHVGVDNLLWAKLKKINQAMRCARAVVHHYHFSRTGEKMDDVYKLAWNDESVRKDRELLTQKLEAINNNNAGYNKEKPNG
jgi:glycosyltransferase involved in cell wall biosynthesis